MCCSNIKVFPSADITQTLVVSCDSPLKLLSRTPAGKFFLNPSDHAHQNLSALLYVSSGIVCEINFVILFVDL